MRLITRFELATRSSSDLRILYRKIFNGMVRSETGSPARRNALATLENIQAELHQRPDGP